MKKGKNIVQKIEKIDSWILLKRMIQSLMLSILFFVVIFLAHGTHISWHREGYLLWQVIIGMSLGMLLMIFSVTLLWQVSFKNAYLFLGGLFLGVFSYLWGYIQLYRLTGFNTDRTIVLLGTALCISFVYYFYRISIHASEERKKAIYIGMFISVLTGVIALIQHFIFHITGVTLFLKIQYLVMALFLFAQTSYDEGHKNSTKKKELKNNRR